MTAIVARPGYTRPADVTRSGRSLGAAVDPIATSVAMAYADGFWVIPRQGAIERTRRPSILVRE